MTALCRDCLHVFEGRGRCPACRSPRGIAHDELFELGIAHLDCDAFYASVEKRDNPALRDRPVIVGGGRRGVVSTACYIARVHGVRSAMPMFQALRLCPDAVVLAPRFDAYVEVSRAIRARMEALTPAVEPLSLDEAFMDLRGTERLHGAPPAVVLADLARLIRAELGVTVSIGLAHNKFLAKLASDLDKPSGFSVIGRGETAAFLRGKPVGMLWGVGASLLARLEAEGIRRIDDLLRWERAALEARFGGMGARLWHLARGEDARRITANAPVKSISKETTLPEDLADPELLDGHLWRLSEQVADRAKAKGVAGQVVTLKLKRSSHRILTRRSTLAAPAQLADVIYRSAAALFARSGERGPFRLIGVGISGLVPSDDALPMPDLADPDAGRRAAAERAADRIRARFGAGAIIKGRALR
ncbi:DNA polymerase IV [Rhodobacteraceae bacterium 2376]|uniref:DNA polymerase IV n=1 Tax=Rhabdonatronobacter sediminivivens TaxID=2743469 RepID=A0A7Z0HY49_9RHOB|nr:DNA polymerase IV [Rhabdonatronobacter sediminivivens]NYS24402.1 DNA polymerase IV [Rhabdonatronobacter sediminivivens]